MRRLLAVCAALTIGLVGGCGSGTAETTTTTGAPTTTATAATTTTAPLATTTTTTIATTTTSEPPAPVTIDPRDYSDATRWDDYYGATEDAEAADLVAEGFTHHHFWGSTVGQTVYTFGLDRLPTTSASLTARLSAEVGGGFGDDPTEVTDVTLLVNGTEVGTITVQYDDGSGTDYTWDVPVGLFLEGDNTLAFEVKEGAGHAFGLCVYGTSLGPAYEDAAIVITFT